MGEITGTSRVRPQFTSPDRLRSAAVFDTMPQTPPEEDISFLAHSSSAPPSHQERRLSNLTAKLSYEMARNSNGPLINDLSVMDVDDTQSNGPKLIKLCIEDLMSPKQNEINNENMNTCDVTGINRSLYSEMTSANAQRQESVQNNNKLEVCAANKLPRFEDDGHQIDSNCNSMLDSTELRGAIQSAIKRRRSLDPSKIIHANQSNQSMLSMNSIDAVNAMETTMLAEIRQFHRFIQFNVNGDGMREIEQTCQQLLNNYVSRLQYAGSEIICQQTSQYNNETNQCTFYLLINREIDINECESKEWMDIFLDIVVGIDEYSWIRTNRKENVSFSQYVPLCVPG